MSNEDKDWVVIGAAVFDKEVTVKNAISLTKEEEEELRDIELEELSEDARAIVMYKGNYRGQSCLEIGSVSINYLKDIMDELDLYFTKIDCSYSVYAQIESDSSGSLYIRDYWEEDRKGGKDKIIFSFGGIL